MSDVGGAGTLILKDMEMFNEAAMLMEKIEVDIFRYLDETIAAWVNEHGWEGEYNSLEGSTSVAPPSWRIPDLEDCFAWFEFENANQDGTDSYDVANLCGCGDTELGFRFRVEHRIFGGKTPWNNCMKDLPESADGLARLEFRDEGKGVWFLPVHIDKDQLALAYENEDYAEAFTPLLNALGKLKEAVPVLDEVLNKARGRI
ncbi:MAG TPA: hypothetical protein VKA14_05820 [Gammaproteobacteria bacterium]|nr:hypothetical protein [Gammaproteobacteria bacterium]